MAGPSFPRLHNSKKVKTNTSYLGIIPGGASEAYGGHWRLESPPFPSHC